MSSKEERYYIINNFFDWPLEKNFQRNTNKRKKHYQSYNHCKEILHQSTYSQDFSLSFGSVGV